MKEAIEKFGVQARAILTAMTNFDVSEYESAVTDLRALANSEAAWAAAQEPETGSAIVGSYKEAAASLRALLDPQIDSDYLMSYYELGDIEREVATLAALIPSLTTITGGETAFSTPTPTRAPDKCAAASDSFDPEFIFELFKDDPEEYGFKRFRKVRMASEALYVEVVDTNWVGSIMKEHQWAFIDDLLNVMSDGGDETGLECLPTVRIRSISALDSKSYIESSTKPSVLRKIYDEDYSEDEWYDSKRYKTKGQIS